MNDELKARLAECLDEPFKRTAPINLLFLLKDCRKAIEEFDVGREAFLKRLGENDEEIWLLRNSCAAKDEALLAITAFCKLSVEPDVKERIYKRALEALSTTDRTQQRELERMRDAAEFLWVVLASVSNGDWKKQTADWQEAAARARDGFHSLCSQLQLRTA